MIMIGVTLRVDDWSERVERRDAIDQRWIKLLVACGCMPVLLPNHLPTVKMILSQLTIRGFLITGGNDLSKYGGDSPEREESERWLLRYACSRGKPLLGVCRGMQLIQDYWKVPLERVEGHVAARHIVHSGDGSASRNSYHRFGARTTVDELEVTARSQDGVIEAVAHREFPIRGIMWHPEREYPFDTTDISMIQQFFEGENAYETW